LFFSKYVINLPPQRYFIMKQVTLFLVMILSSMFASALQLAPEKKASKFTSVLEGLSTGFILFGVIIAVAGGSYYIYRQFNKDTDNEIV
jgi:amino acid transporter